MLADAEIGQLKFLRNKFSILQSMGESPVKFKIRTCSNVKTKVNKSSFQD